MNKPLFLPTALKRCAMISLLAASGLSTAGVVLAEDTPQQGHWQLADLYASDAEWNTALKKVAASLDKLPCSADGVVKGPAALASCLDDVSQVQRTLKRLSVYASLAADEDLRNASAQERNARVQQVSSRLGQKLGFLAPTLLQLPKGTLEQWAATPQLELHRRYLEQLREQAGHTLPAETESALAALSPVMEGASESYSLLANADITWPTLTIDGKQVTLDQSAYERWRSHPDPAIRKRVFDAFWATWHHYTNTAGSLLGTTVNQHVIDARLRHYKSARAAALAANEIPDSVYDGLLAGAEKHLPTLHRYLDLRRRMLGLKTLSYSDLYVPLGGKSPTYTLTDAKQLLQAAVQPLGEDYVKGIEKINRSPWTSAYPATAKRSGAYMNGAAYDVHPYVLMNFNGDYNSVSTYAHEWGHGMHSILSNRHQPFETADYPIFLAEIASTTNEELLVDHVLRSNASRQQQIYYLAQALDSLRSTFFRQAQFAEFEANIHAAVERGEALSGERLTRMYGDTLRKYYGVDKGVTDIDPAYYVEWAFVPHFYYDFYVYQYATSITAANYFASHIEQGDTQVRDTYLKMLSQGGSQNPYQLLRSSGVDLASSAPYDALAARMDKLMDKIEQLLADDK
ncbi:oligoendopeptidase F [Carnimonas bestiolae]|uniref:oligoendopeptidase F n=1 Tax=Carnimonas bestiolae TaxID=3402172 RepID=UPI003EDC2B23